MVLCRPEHAYSFAVLRSGFAAVRRGADANDELFFLARGADALSDQCTGFRANSETPLGTKIRAGFSGFAEGRLGEPPGGEIRARWRTGAGAKPRGSLSTRQLDPLPGCSRAARPHVPG